MSERDILHSESGSAELRDWEGFIQEHPCAGGAVMHDPLSPFDELHWHNTILHLVVLNFYSLTDAAKVVTMLLGFGANPNSQNDKGETPLHLACQATRRDPDIVKILLKYGADPLLRTKDGKQAIDFLGNHDPYSREIFAVLKE